MTMTKTKTAEAKYPEHEKLKAHQSEVSTLSSFIDFLMEQEWEIAQFDNETDRMYPVRKRPEEIIGMFLEIDPVKLEKEKRAMLEKIRSAQPRKDGEG